MSNKPYTLSFALFYVALFFCGITRVYLKYTSIDPETGFYSRGGALPYAFGGVLAAVAVLIFLQYILRRSDHDYPVLRLNRALGVIAVLVGVSIIFYMFEVLRLFSFGTLNPGVQLGKISLIVTALFGELSALAFLMIGVRGIISPRGMHGGLLPLIPGLWQLVTLVSKFNAYPTLVTISDNLLAVMFTLFAATFLVGHARTLSGLARTDGRNYTIPTGLCTALFGFVLVLPNWIWMLSDRTWKIPAPLLGGFESVFIFFLSVYALVFVHKLARGIKRV